MLDLIHDIKVYHLSRVNKAEKKLNDEAKSWFSEAMNIELGNDRLGRKLK